MFPLHTRRYDVHGTRLLVQAESTSLADSLERVLSPFSVTTESAPDYHISLRHGEPSRETENLHLIWQGEWASGVNISCYSDEKTRVFHIPQSLTLRVDLGRHCCEAVVRMGEERVCIGCLTLVLCEFLGEANQHVLHAACLAEEIKGQKQAILLGGVCGSGKTTTALALVRQGMSLLADDAAFLVQRDAGWRVWGLPRPCKVHRMTAEIMPWLKTIERRPIANSEEFAVDFCRLPTGDPHWELSPGLIVLLEARNDREHRLQEIPKPDALFELTRQNVRAMRGFAVDRAGRSFHAISSLVIHSRVFRLSVGPDLNSLAALLRSCLEN